MESNVFVPVEKSHKTHTYTGTGDIKPLHVTKHVDEGGCVTLNSVWYLYSLWERVKFLYTGQITLRVMGTHLPPMSVVAGDIFEGDK